ncbi:MAG TPA: STAS domain-containing protein [Bryobacteraceae bacterium]|nr:STAS domain-containing protein [Bryobacteraceae bacterium]
MAPLVLRSQRVLTVSISTEVHQDGAVSVLSVEGKLVMGAPSNAFRATVEDLLKAGNQRIVVNFRGVPYADSAGIGALAYNFSNTKAAGGRLALAEVQPAVLDVMDVTRLSDLIPMFETEKEAVKSLGAN